MKLLMVICPRERETDVRTLIERHDVHAFTQISDVLGEGEKGRKLGTHDWPGRLSLLFTVVPVERLESLKSALREFAGKLYPDEGLRAFVLPVDEMI